MVMLLVLGLPLSCATAEVYTTGNVNLRTGPGLNYDAMGSVPEGSELEYLGEISTDERGVDWYKVDYKGRSAWISSKYSELRGEQIWELDAYDPHADTVELSGLFMQGLEESARQAGLTSFRVVQSEAPYQYYNDAAILGGYSNVDYIEVCGTGYSVYGVTLGMDAREAKALLTEAGLVLFDEYDDVIVFEHRANENSYDLGLEFDSCINLWLSGGCVTSLDWSVYTG